MDIYCKKCKRWLGETDKTFIGTIKCSNSKCKHNNNIKIVFSKSSLNDIRYKFSEANKEELEKKEIADKEKQEIKSVADSAKKENEQLKSELEDLNVYIKQLEGIIDGQG